MTIWLQKLVTNHTVYRLTYKSTSDQLTACRQKIHDLLSKISTLLWQRNFVKISTLKKQTGWKSSTHVIMNNNTTFLTKRWRYTNHLPAHLLTMVKTECKPVMRSSQCRSSLTASSIFWSSTLNILPLCTTVSIVLSRNTLSSSSLQMHSVVTLP